MISIRLHITFCEEKYNATTFKTSRALRNKLTKYNVQKAWDEVFGEQTDFLHPELKNMDNVISNMNQFGNMCDNLFVGHSSDLLGYILIELCRFCVSFLHIIPTNISLIFVILLVASR